MISDDLRKRVFVVIDSLRGSSEEILGKFDEFIEDGLISQEEFDRHEVEILDIVDNEIFNCTSCGWTLNVDEMGEDTENGELQCKSCDDSGDGRGY